MFSFREYSFPLPWMDYLQLFPDLKRSSSSNSGLCQFCASKLLTLAFLLWCAVLCYKSSQITDDTKLWKTMEKQLDGRQ